MTAEDVLAEILGISVDSISIGISPEILEREAVKLAHVTFNYHLAKRMKGQAHYPTDYSWGPVNYHNYERVCPNIIWSVDQFKAWLVSYGRSS